MFFRRIVDILPDRGEKVNKFRDDLEVELNKRRVHEKMCEDMSLLKIGQDQLDSLEWNGKHLPHTVQKMNTQHNKDKHDKDILKMFISHSGVYQDKIIIKYKVYFNCLNCVLTKTSIILLERNQKNH